VGHRRRTQPDPNDEAAAGTACHLLDLQDLDELRGIHGEPDAVVIAAMMPQPRWPGRKIRTKAQMIAAHLLAVHDNDLE
jgi:hypothetical protein